MTVLVVNARNQVAEPINTHAVLGANMCRHCLIPIVLDVIDDAVSWNHWGSLNPKCWKDHEIRVDLRRSDNG